MCDVQGLMVGLGGRSGEFNSSRDIYVADNVYSLLGTRTGHVVNLLMGQDAIIDDPAGRRLRSVELDVQRLRCCRCRDGLGGCKDRSFNTCLASPLGTFMPSNEEPEPWGL